MTFEFTLPDVGEGVSEGELVSWLVDPGDTVSEDQPVAEVETDKALVEIPSPINGTVKEQLYEAGDTVPVGEVFIIFDVEGEEPSEPAEEPTTDDSEGEVAAADEHVFAPPSVRRLARELEVDIEGVEGSGPGGRITEGDVRAAAEGAQEVPEEPTPSVQDTTQADASADRDQTLAAPATRRIAREAGVDIDEVPASEEHDGEALVTAADVEAYAAGEGVTQSGEPAVSPPQAATENIPYRGVRRTIGEQMERSVYTAPHVTHHELIEVDALVDTREELKAVAEERGVKLTYLPFVIKALIATLREHPKLNAELDEEAEEIKIKSFYNVGIATATEAGLMVPVIKRADEKGLLDLASESRELAQRARERTIAPEDFQDGTITITNFGAIGGDYATPIINYPEVTVVGLGELKQRPVVRDGEVEAAWTLPLSITIDHRVVDGAEVAEFAGTLGEYLSNPQRLLLA